MLRPGRRFAAICFLFLALGTVGLHAPSAARAQGADAGNVAEREPTREEVVQSEVAQALYMLADVLETRYPDAYGGIVATSDSSRVIKVLEGASSSDELRAYVRDQERNALTRTGRTLRFSFEPVAVTQVRLEEVRGQLADELVAGGRIREAGATAVGLDGVGVAIETEPGREQEVTAAVDGRYPDVRIAILPAEQQTLTSRYADTAPWNGGDVLAAHYLGVTTPLCTSGPGAHNSTGQHFLLYAGHCGSGFWYNTNYGNPQPNNPMGWTAGLVQQPNAPDAAIIGVSSSYYFWKGPDNGTRTTTYYQAIPTVGDTVCGQGALTAALGQTSCGVISQVNQTAFIPNPPPGMVYTLLFSYGSPSISGDSGGYVSISGPFGNGVVGTITSSNSSSSRATDVAAHLFIWGLSINTPFNP